MPRRFSSLFLKSLLFFIWAFLSYTSVFSQKTTTLLTPAIDFSYAGYKNGEVSLPSPPTILKINPTGKDDSALIQAAIDHVRKLPVKENGFRGAIQLSPGRFYVTKPINLSLSGVVLRGSGENLTTIIALGNERYTLLKAGNGTGPETTESVKVVDEVVPAGNMKLKLESVAGFCPGDQVVLTRPSTKEWISSLGMDTLSGTFAEMRYHWNEGSRNLLWDRKIRSVDMTQNQVVLDAPVTTSLEQKYGGANLVKATSNVPLHHIGIENLAIESSYNIDNPKDEEHAWFGIFLDNIEDSWVRNVTSRHFVSSAVRVGPRARRITILNCHNEDPVSEVGGSAGRVFL